MLWILASSHLVPHTKVRKQLRRFREISPFIQIIWFLFFFCFLEKHVHVFTDLLNYSPFWLYVVCMTIWFNWLSVSMQKNIITYITSHWANNTPIQLWCKFINRDSVGNIYVFQEFSFCNTFFIFIICLLWVTYGGAVVSIVTWKHEGSGFILRSLWVLFCYCGFISLSKGIHCNSGQSESPVGVKMRVNGCSFSVSLQPSSGLSSSQNEGVN